MQSTTLQARLRATFHKAVPSRPVSCRGYRLVVQAKVDLKGGPRIIKGKCYVTKDVSGALGH